MPKFNPNPSALEKMRREAKMTREKLAEASGVNLRTIEAYEQKRIDINIASVKIVQALAQALKVPIEKILDE